MEAESISVETSAPDALFPKLPLELEKLGFEDIHKKALESVCCNLKESLNVDFMKRVSFKKKVNAPRPHLFINTETNSVIVVSEPEDEGFVTGKTAFEVTCFAKTQNDADNLVENLKKLLKQSGLRKDTIHDGDFDENCNKYFIRSISETSRGALIKEASADILNVFTQSIIRKGLKRFTTLPFQKKFFDEHMFMFFEEEGEAYSVDPHSLVSRGIMEEKFCLECKKCGPSPMVRTPLFNLKKEASSTLQKEVLLCSSCGNKLTSESATIASYFQFTHLGLECAKGLWLEAYVKSILEELGVKEDRIKCSAVHVKDELDLVFTYYGDLYICECRDRVVGRNDAYVLAMKVSRINEAEEAKATVNKVLTVSTEPISKDIISTGKQEGTELEYLFIGGDIEEIKKKLVEVTKKARRRYKREKLRELSMLLLDCLPPKSEEIYKRVKEEWYPPF